VKTLILYLALCGTAGAQYPPPQPVFVPAPIGYQVYTYYATGPFGVCLWPRTVVVPVYQQPQLPAPQQ